MIPQYNKLVVFGVVSFRVRIELLYDTNPSKEKSASRAGWERGTLEPDVCWFCWLAGVG